MKPFSIMKLYLLSFFTLLSCSIFVPNYKVPSHEFSHTTSEYIFFLNKQFKEFKKNHKNDFIHLKRKESRYLEKLSKTIIQKNSTFFSKLKNSTIHFSILRSDIPFYMSLPFNKILLSTEIFKYIENEALLASLITYELIRLEKYIYTKYISPPIGNSQVQDLLSLSQIDHSHKNQLHQWSYLLLKRTPFQGNIYLLWLQIIIRNIEKFKIFIQNNSSILREERLLKSFIIKDEQSMGTTFQIKNKKRQTSPVFYSLLKRMKNVSPKT